MTSFWLQKDITAILYGKYEHGQGRYLNEDGDENGDSEYGERLHDYYCPQTPLYCTVSTVFRFEGSTSIALSKILSPVLSTEDY